MAAHRITADIRRLLEEEGGSLEQLEKAAEREELEHPRVYREPVNLAIGGGDPWTPTGPAA